MTEIDLNLLRVFDTLMELRSVTRAADRLSLTQSAISHALGRLRLALGDRLFVRGPGGLQPTARAMEMAPGVRDGLTRFREAMAPTSFVPATAERRFVVAAGTYFCAMLVPMLAARIRREAPGVSLKIVELAEDLSAALDRGSIDIALGAFVRVPSRVMVEPLFREELVWIAAVDNPLVSGPLLGGPINSATLAAQPRILISAARGSEGYGGVVSEGGLDRRVIVDAGQGFSDVPAEGASTVYDSQTAIAMVWRTDTVALVPRRSALEEIARGRVAILDTVERATGIDLSMIWHRKQREDRGLAWLRQLVLESAQPPAAGP
jgi:DNA-binding transcriptional LysR family regulator